MREHNQCPKCGVVLPKNSPAGICPKCLLRAGLENTSESQPDRSAVGGSASAPFVPPTTAELAGLFPQLEVLELIGCGGMGAVYKARQTRLDRWVALKIIRPDATLDRSFADRFNREARTLARLSHQHIVTVHDFGEVLWAEPGHAQGRPLYFFIMEYVDGSNLRQVIATQSLKPADALAIVPQICEALQFAHDEGVVHRDIKPENILMDKRGRVKIADFGLAKLTARSIEEYTITGTHQVMGTPRYMAPEQMEASHTVDHRADIYSLGVVFYEMLTGEVPAGHFDPPSKKVEVDVRLDEVVLRSLAQKPERRYQHASDVQTDVERISGTPASRRAMHPLGTDRTGDIASAPRLSRIASRVWQSISADRTRKAARQHVAVNPVPSGFPIAATGLFSVGWIAAGVLRHYGPVGLAAAIALLALIAFSLVRWKLTFLPELRDELATQSPIRHGAKLGVSLVLFALAMLAVEYFHTDALDWHYFARIGAVPGAMSTCQLSGELTPLGLSNALVDELDVTTRLHRASASQCWIMATLFGAVAVLLLLASATTALGTRRFQYSWLHRWGPAVQVVFLLWLSLCVVVVAFMVMDLKKGWAVTRPTVFRCQGTVDDFQGRVQQWAVDNGYERQLNIYGTQSDVDFASYRLEPTSSLDRWQFEKRYLVRPRPPISVTCLKQSGDAQVDTQVLVELPWVGMESPEEVRWPALVASLRKALETTDDGAAGTTESSVTK